MHFLKTVAFFVSFALTVNFAFAATLDVSGVKLDDSLSIYNNQLVLNGAGAVTQNNKALYVSGAYAKQKFNTLDEFMSAPGPKRLMVAAVKEVDTNPISKQFSRGLEAVAQKGDMAKLIPGLTNMSNIFNTARSLKPGEVMTMDWIPVTGMVIYINGRVQGVPFREPEFFKAAMWIWMGDTPLDPKLKESLLGHTKLAS